MPQLDISTYSSQIFWLLACFGVLCITITTVFAPRFARVLAERDAQITSYTEQAAFFVKEAEALNTQLTEKNMLLRQEISEKQKRFTDDLAHKKTVLLSEFDHNVALKIKTAQVAFQADRTTIFDNMSSLLTQTTLFACPKILGTISEEQIKQAVDSVLKQQLLT